MIVAAPLVLALLVGAPAQPATAGAPASASAPDAKVAAQKVEAKSDVKTIVGQIVAVDAAKGIMTVGESMQASRPQTSKLRESLTLSIDAKTQLFRGKRPATKEELKQHDHVVVRYVVTPQGPRVLTCRVSDLVTRTPPPAPTAQGATAAAGTSATN